MTLFQQLLDHVLKRGIIKSKLLPTEVYLIYDINYILYWCVAIMLSKIAYDEI